MSAPTSFPSVPALRYFEAPLHEPGCLGPWHRWQSPPLPFLKSTKPTSEKLLGNQLPDGQPPWAPTIALWVKFGSWKQLFTIASACGCWPAQLRRPPPVDVSWRSPAPTIPFRKTKPVTLGSPAVPPSPNKTLGGKAGRWSSQTSRG